MRLFLIGPLAALYIGLSGGGAGADALVRKTFRYDTPDKCEIDGDIWFCGFAPFASQPGEDIAAEALSPGLGAYQLAWPFTPLVLGDLDEFIDRWVGWLADATQGRLNFPSTMPEQPAQWQR